MTIKTLKFLYLSNLIENELSGIALLDAAKAWNFLQSADKIGLDEVLDTHAFLMGSVNPRIAGMFRTSNVRVGDQIMLKSSLIILRLSGLLETIPKTEEEIKQWHIEFENIHPFEDGNGRVGRIIMNWQRIKNNLPLLVIHTGSEQNEYYDWFKNKKENKSI